MAIERNPVNGNEDCYFAKMLIALELRRTHGVVFAAFFLRQYESEIARALLTRQRSHDDQPTEERLDGYARMQRPPTTS